MGKMTSLGRLIVITGPSGVGKGSIVKRLLERNTDLWLSISATTRPPREGEENEVHYFFLDRAEFEKLVREDGFLEWAEFADNLYGTLKEQVQYQLRKGKNVLLEIELEGARQIRKSFSDAYQVFIAPPSFQELEKRIRGRGTEIEDAIKKRLDRAKEELQAQDEFDEVVINDDIDLALSRLEQLIKI